MLRKWMALALFIPISGIAQFTPEIPGFWKCRFHQDQGKELCCWTVAAGETDICYEPNDF